MDYPLASNRWRTRALVAGTVAAVELVLLLGVAAAVLGRTLVGGVEEAARARALAPVQPRPKPAPAKQRPLLERAEISVVVLNGNGIAGAASESAAKVRALTYVVSTVGNAARSDYGKSVVMFRPGYRVEAERLARDLGVKLVGPLDGLRTRDLMGAHLALVVGQ